MSKFTGVRFYFRDSNKWSNFLKLHAGFDASFVLDKTTDSANISFIMQNEPEQIKINTWVALFINADSSEFEFNADGTPKNHEQFIVGGYQYYKTLAGYEVTMKLIEPIERFRGVLGETLSYTNQTSKVQDDITYVKDPYNYYTALKRWLQVTPANTDDISRDSEKKDTNGIAWWNRITILDKEFLESLPFADDTLNELSLYDLLLDVYDSGTGRTPVAYFDLNTATGNPNNLNRDEYLLKFIRQDGADKPIIEWDNLTTNKGSGEVCTGIMKREDGANYATGLVANITNLSPNTTITFPARNVFANPQVIAEVRDTTKYTEAGKNNWGIVLPHKIKTVNTVRQYEIDGFYDSGPAYVKDEYRKVMERKQRDADFEENDWEAVDVYDEGDNILYTENYAYIPIGKSPNALLYSLEYEPLIDARVCVGNQEYAQQINQTSSQVDSDKFGKFMQNYLAGMGKADYTIQRTTEKPEEYINLIGSKVRSADKMFIITNIALRNRNLQYDVFFQLNQNHLRKNMSYQAPQNIRPNIAIQYSNVQARKTNITDKMVLALERPTGRNIKYLQDVAWKAVLNALLPHSLTTPDISQSFYPQFANIINNQKFSDEILDKEQTSTNIAPFVFGNYICINIKYLDNAIAGKGTSSVRYDSNNFPVQFIRIANQTPALYTDAFGEVDKTTIKIISTKEILQENQYGYGHQDVVNNIYPIARDASSIYTGFIKSAFTIIEIPKLNLQKDMLEEYNITYSLEVTGGKNVTVFPELLQYSRLINQTAISKKLHVIAYDDYDGQGNIIGETDLDSTRAYLIDYHIHIYHNIIGAKSILLQSVIDDKTIVNCLLINGDAHSYVPGGFNIYF